ncbi:sigma-70 family RNA polymerase sigma factor [Telmatocola sphagniphila]|uniref:Sigma-70 family RNA polymerase sigma factor n=1 Tax=Telmatocola sphagniphila TaxID=1123043 RepID=A0A8E6EZM6_9BACT|nr:ECF-type sigma factor [Telmatocola sphagniphila]QVL33908.1 sigma-70 family RNA polymerase sigma factor [Telmatocola sphagniphila]QVL34025.1 sigma-70 family RNA polymerase sigma factor [Telmatocola sphagniphila]
MSDLTQLLVAAHRGNNQAAAELLPLVYEELRKLAAARMALETPGQTLEATALVHEAYLRLVGDQHFEGRGHFFAAAAEAMRRILVEKARSKSRLKRGGQLQQKELEQHEPSIKAPVEAIDILALNESLERLEAKSFRKSQLVKLRYFAGCTLAEAAAILSISLSTAEEDWTYAKVWLKRDMQREAK